MRHSLSFGLAKNPLVFKASASLGVGLGRPCVSKSSVVADRSAPGGAWSCGMGGGMMSVAGRADMTVKRAPALMERYRGNEGGKRKT